MWGWAIFFIICFFGLAYLYFDEKQNEAKQKVDRSKKEFENSIDLIKQIMREIESNENSDPPEKTNIEINATNVNLYEPRRNEDLSLIGVGDLKITQKEIIFLSTQQTRTINVSNLLKVDVFVDGVRIYVKNRQRPMTFSNLSTPNAIADLLLLFNEMNEKFSINQWDMANFLDRCKEIIKELKERKDSISLK